VRNDGASGGRKVVVDCRFILRRSEEHCFVECQFFAGACPIKLLHVDGRGRGSQGLEGQSACMLPAAAR
jgi:hypothetical protein